jgi:K(+)-stimulated pyrophosphate-energized sodium pump
MSNEMWAYVIALAVSLLAIGVAIWMALWVKKLESDNQKIEYVSNLIKRGANTFLKREYTILAVFAGILFVFILIFLPKPIWQVGDEVNIHRALPT